MVKDLTVGRPQTVLRQFTIPMFVSVIFQQMYNIADSIIAGKFAGEDALAAVGISYPITMIFMAIAIGSNIGCSVVISGLFGAKEYKNMKSAVSTTLIASLSLSIFLTIAGLLLSNSLMHMINTPANIFADSDLYLQIYIAGFGFVFLYNVATGIFTSLGDSKTPLYFLIGSSIGNVILDYVFVAQFNMGVAGVAWATFIAQGIACILALITLKFRLANIHTKERYQLFSWKMLKKISLIAVPSILQQSFISVGNILIQSLINGCGSGVIAGYSAAVKLNTFTLTSLTTLGNGMSNFTAQNIGAGKAERIKDGFKAAIRLAFSITIPFFIGYFFFGKPLIGLFLKEKTTEALDTGVLFLRIVSPFYFIIAVKLMADGVLRGSAAMKAFMTATFTDLVLRVILAYILFVPFDTLGIWLSWPIGWTVAMIMSYVFYLHRSKELIEQYSELSNMSEESVG